MEKQTITTPELDSNSTQTAGYLEILPMTFDERVKMYMRLTKLELARMLAERDRLGIDDSPRVIPCPYPVPQYPQPSYPSVPFPNTPWYEYSTTCDSSDESISAQNNLNV